VTDPTTSALSSDRGRWPERLSGRAELALVLLPTVGLFTLSAVIRLVQRHGAPTLLVTDALLWRLFSEEVVVGVVVTWFLARRGWRFARMSAPAEGYDVLRSIGVLAYSWLVLIALSLTFWLISPELLRAAAGFRFTGHLSWPPIAAVVILDPIFEELLFLGYLVNRLRHRGILVAAGVSIGLRTIIHLYQGPMALLGILPIGVVYTRCYLRNGRLWPVIGAHMCQDALAFLIQLRSAA
jgi:membrane protease YdiL (CAAX protease family)